MFALMFLLSACATRHPPEQVPELNPAVFPALQIPSLKPQVVSFSIKNTRAINAQFGNTKQVEAAVQDAVMQSIARGGLTVKPNSKNILSLEINDCPNTDPNLECVILMLNLKTPRYEVEVDDTSQDGLRHQDGGTIPGAANISKAYQDGLVAVLKGLPPQVVHMLSKLKE